MTKTELNPFVKEEKQHLELSIGEQSGVNQMYATNGFKTLTDKAKLFNFINEKGISFEEIINKQIAIKHIYIEIINITDEHTGELVEVPRTVIIDKDDKSYSGASFGIYNSLKKLISIFGEPNEDNIINVEFKQVKRGTKSTYTLKAI